MFTWLKQFFTTEPYDLYRPRQRLIFHYFNGTKILHADPILLYKRLMDRGTDIDIDRKVAASNSKDALKAHGNLVNTLREVFEVKTLAGGGLTDQEVIDLMDHFLNFMETIKKKSNSSMTSSKGTWDATEPAPATNPTTAPASASGCSANGSTTATPPPLPSASVLPTASSTPG